MKPIFADNAAIEQAAKLLRQGRLVAFPTETVYGLGADASNAEAIKQIFAVKGRPTTHPLIVHIGDADQIKDWAQKIPDNAKKLASHFWPGPLTLILNKKNSVPSEVTGGQNTIALRMPDHPVALALLNKFEGGIAAPSANIYCRISPTQASHVEEELGDTIDMILDGGACRVGVESTIIDLTGPIPKLLRPGHISKAEIEAVLDSELQIVTASANGNKSTETMAPGMMPVHYAPTTRAALCEHDKLPQILNNLRLQNKRVGLLSYQFNPPENRLMHMLCMPEQAESYAQILYTCLRELDNRELDIILIEQTPDTEAWRAINDRIKKATSNFKNN
ncbi:MAG: L-threonylcarbamoyladenylate synthase [Methylococcales bacterium]|nr:L-threonylcarbamoyladenylate synthase [Methylococcales bacterium]